MTRTEIEAVVRGLTKAQRECVMSASETIGGNMQVWHSHLGTIKSVWKKGLCSEPNYRGQAIEAPLGLAVRTHLKATQEDQPC
jgi:hypothetical protein